MDLRFSFDCDRVPVTCDDPNAQNYGEAGECEYDDGGRHPHILLSWTEFTGVASIPADGANIMSYEWVYSGYME